LPDHEKNEGKIPFPEIEIFKVHGHRGFGLEKPENTMEAFRESVNLGLDYVEIDVWLTSDKIPIICHADTYLGKCEMIDPITNLTKIIFISKTKYETLKELTYTKSGSHIHTFEELVIYLKDTSVKINCEIKDWNPEIVTKLLDIIIKHNALDSIFFSSFDFKHRKTIKRDLLNRG